jgi:glycosyltransferase involved in cell wall biosynthesis
VRIAHFIQRYPPALGGSEAYFARLSRFLADQGDEVTVFTSAAIDLHAFWSPRGECLLSGVEREEGITVRRYRLARWPGRRYLLKAFSRIPHRTWQCLTMPCNPICWGMWRDAGKLREAFDVVHASAFPYAWPIVCARRLARRLGVPFFLTPFLHLGDPTNPRDRTRRAYTSPALRSLLLTADRVFVQTESERREVLRQGVPATKTILQGLGVDSAECTGGDREAARRGWGVGPDEVVIGHLANNSVEKGSVDLLRAAERLWQCSFPFRVVLAGTEMPNFQQFWQQYALRERVLRLGPLSDTAKRDFYAAIDVFALPSRSDSFGLVLLEAWANGLPNVAYRAGGIADVIRHEEDGLLAPCGDVGALAAALGRLVRNSALREDLGRQGRGRLPLFAWADKLQIVRQAYAKCCVLRYLPAR